MRLPAIVLATVLLLTASARAADREIQLSYQGRVTVGGVNASTTGYFKFALVDSTGVQIWSNDGTSTGSQFNIPEGDVQLTISARGVFSVKLGDTSLGMVALRASDLNHDGLRLRVWFNDTAHLNFPEQLEPDLFLSNSAYSFTADSVPAGSVTAASLATGAVTSAKIATGAVTAEKIASGALLDNIRASAAGLPAGSVVFGETPNSATLLAAGFVRLSDTTTGNDAWSTLNATSPPPGAQFETAVWTGTDLLTWGGLVDGTPVNTGYRYNLASNTWTTLPTAGAPSARLEHSAVWTGTEMIIFGGRNDATYYTSGARYNLAANTWTALPAFALPTTTRCQHSAVWSGSQMIVFGGHNATTWWNDGGVYTPATNTWTGVTFSGAPAGRHGHCAHWTGTGMIVWGGRSKTTTYNNGGIYNPVSNTWAGMSSSPESRYDHASAWTGTELIVWGGSFAETLNAGNTTYETPYISHVRTGGRYSPTSNSWLTFNNDGAPAAAGGAKAVWTGSEFVVWGGTYSHQTADEPWATGLSSGGRYRPSDNLWLPISSDAAPAARTAHHIFWTGSQALVYGGYSETETVLGIYSSLHLYRPSVPLTVYLKQ